MNRTGPRSVRLFLAMSDRPETIRTFPTLEALSQAAARDMRTHIASTLETQDGYALALAGGSTPERLYQLLSEDPDLPWTRIHLFWGDERFVPHDHPKSNVRMARRTLIDAAPIPAQNVHPIPFAADAPDAAAASYAKTLHSAFTDRETTFDTALLGLGADGHTASLFPETDGLLNDRRWVRVVTAPDRHDVATRISCTLPVLNRSRRVVFLVTGEKKRKAVRRVLDEEDESLPATHIRPYGSCEWYVDEAARPPGSP